MSDGSRHVQVPLLKNWLPDSGEIAYTAHLESGLDGSNLAQGFRSTAIATVRGTVQTIPAKRFSVKKSWFEEFCVRQSITDDQIQ